MFCFRALTDFWSEKNGVARLEIADLYLAFVQSMAIISNGLTSADFSTCELAVL